MPARDPTPPKADVVGPAVTTDDPDAFFAQVVDDRAQVTRCGRIQCVQLPGDRLNTLALFVYICLICLRCIQHGLHYIITQLTSHRIKQGAGIAGMLIISQPEAQAEFGIVFKQRIGPGRTSALRIGSVGA